MESVTHYHVYAYHKSGGYEAKRFEGDAVTASAQAIHYADQIAHTCDYAEVRNAVGDLTTPSAIRTASLQNNNDKRR